VFRQRVKFVVGIAVCAGLLGCGSGASLVPAKGKVVYQGQPVAGANVTFVPKEGTPAIGVTDANGEFTVNTVGKPGLPAGLYKVGVTKFSSTGTNASMTPEDMVKMQAGGKMPEVKNEVPAKYAAAPLSGLEANVTSDKTKNVFTFELKD
jgi:hypothetical protein